MYCFWPTNNLNLARSVFFDLIYYQYILSCWLNAYGCHDDQAYGELQLYGKEKITSNEVQDAKKVKSFFFAATLIGNLS